MRSDSVQRLPLQNTIAGFETFIPTLEKAFAAAGIAERESWGAVSGSLLARLEAETEALRQKYVSSQLQQPTDQKPKSAAASDKLTNTDKPITKPAAQTSTDKDDAKPAAQDASTVAQQPDSQSQKPQATSQILQLPQAADEDDAVDLDEVEDGKSGMKHPAASNPSDDWNGDVL